MNAEKWRKVMKEKAILNHMNRKPKYEFTPTNYLYISDQSLDFYIGNLSYDSLGFRVGCAIKTGECFFFLESVSSEIKQYAGIDPNTWTLSGICGDAYYNFTTIQIPNELGLIERLITYVIDTFLVVGYPEIFINIPKEQISWRSVPL